MMNARSEAELVLDITGKEIDGLHKRLNAYDGPERRVERTELEEIRQMLKDLVTEFNQFKLDFHLTYKPYIDRAILAEKESSEFWKKFFHSMFHRVADWLLVGTAFLIGFGAIEWIKMKVLGK